MLRSPFKTDWRKSPPHLLFLSNFQEPRPVEDFLKSDNWQVVLKETPRHIIKRFVDDGVLIQADIGGHVAYRFKVTELKNMLRARGLPLSGRKEDLVARLVQADGEGMRQAVEGLIVFQCTEQGRAVVQQYLNREKEKRAQVEHQVVDAIHKRRFKEACQLVAVFEAGQVFQRGLGIEWKNYDPGRDVAILERVFDGIPKKLGGLKTEIVEQIRVAAAMMHLWGTNSGTEWLLFRTMTGSEIDNDLAIRMVLSHAMYRHELAQYKRTGVKTVKIYTCNDAHVCNSCRKLANRSYKLIEAPELPYEGCTCELGCRCWVVPGEFSR